jgi:hypothetical protein
VITERTRPRRHRECGDQRCELRDAATRLALSGNGVTVNNVVVVDPTTITCTITVSSAASLGSRILTVTNRDGDVAQNISAITIT